LVNGLDDRVGPGNADVEYRHDVAIPTTGLITKAVADMICPDWQ
jgi:hypothetical protein